jgi:hypothetical protein
LKWCSGIVVMTRELTGACEVEEKEE